MVLCGGVGHVGCWMREVAVGGPVWWFFLLSPLLCPLPALPVGTYKAAGREGERKRRKKRGEEGGTGSESLKWMVKTAHSPSGTSVRLFFLFLRSPARPVGCGWWGVLGRLSLEQWKERKKKHKKKKEKRRRRSENFKLKLKTTHSLSGASLRLFFHFLTGGGARWVPGLLVPRLWQHALSWPPDREKGGSGVEIQGAKPDPPLTPPPGLVTPQNFVRYAT